MDERARNLERAAAANGDPAAVAEAVAELRRLGEHGRAWSVLASATEEAAHGAARALREVGAFGPNHDEAAHVAAWRHAALSIDKDKRLRVLDGRTHVAWERGQTVMVANGACMARPPKGDDDHPDRAVPRGRQGRVIWIGVPPEERGTPARTWHYTDGPARVGEPWRLGVELLPGPDGLERWTVWTVAHNVRRVPAPAWDALDTDELERAGRLPARKSKVEARVRAKDGLIEVVKGEVVWSGVRGGVIRVGVRRRGASARVDGEPATVWCDLDAVKVLAPPAQRCVRARFPR